MPKIFQNRRLTLYLRGSCAISRDEFVGEVMGCAQRERVVIVLEIMLVSAEVGTQVLIVTAFRCCLFSVVLPKTVIGMKRVGVRHCEKYGTKAHERRIVPPIMCITCVSFRLRLDGLFLP